MKQNNEVAQIDDEKLEDIMDTIIEEARKDDERFLCWNWKVS